MSLPACDWQAGRTHASQSKSLEAMGSELQSGFQYDFKNAVHRDDCRCN